MTIEVGIIFGLIVVCIDRQIQVNRWHRLFKATAKKCMDAMDRNVDIKASREKTIRHMQKEIDTLKREKPKRIIPAIAVEEYQVCDCYPMEIGVAIDGSRYCPRCYNGKEE